MKESDPRAPSNMSRRGFIRELAAAALTSGLVSVTARKAAAQAQERLRPQARPKERATEEETIEALKDRTYTDRQPIHEQVIELSTSLFRDVEVVLDRVVEQAADYEDYETLFALIQAELPLDTIPEPLQSTLREMMLYTPYVESRFDVTAVSNQGAFGIMQLMPVTWNEHAREGEDMSSVIDQVQVAGRLLEQIHRYLMGRHEATIAAITTLVYAGDTERCQREFVGPVILAGYFCGMGTVSNLLDNFAHDYIDIADIERMQSENIVAEEYGLYSLCCKAGEVHQYDGNFGSEAAIYFQKILAARLSVRVSISDDVLASLLQGTDTAVQ